MHPDVEVLATLLLRTKAVPAKAPTDAVHIAIAALQEIKFSASWNFRHAGGRVSVKAEASGLTQ